MNMHDARISLEGLGLFYYPCHTLEFFGVRFIPPQVTIVWGNNLFMPWLFLNIRSGYTGLSSPAQHWR